MNVVYMIALPATFMMLIVGIATQLEDIAHDSADKAVAFADDMNSAMGCATRGVPITTCSPTLMSHDFSDEQQAYMDTLENISQTLDEAQAGQAAGI